MLGFYHRLKSVVDCCGVGEWRRDDAGFEDIKNFEVLSGGLRGRDSWFVVF